MLTLHLTLIDLYVLIIRTLYLINLHVVIQSIFEVLQSNSTSFDGVLYVFTCIFVRFPRQTLCYRLLNFSPLKPLRKKMSNVFVHVCVLCRDEFECQHGLFKTFFACRKEENGLSVGFFCCFFQITFSIFFMHLDILYEYVHELKLYYRHFL